jgi:hypothetical protein
MVDGRLKPIRIGNQVIHFKTAATSRLFWAGRPAVRIVQALHWMQDVLSRPEERQKAIQQLKKVLESKNGGNRMREDLRNGFSALPIWMQKFVDELLKKPGSTDRLTGPLHCRNMAMLINVAMIITMAVVTLCQAIIPT